MKFADLIGLLCVIAALVILWQFRQILLLVFTAVVLAIALNALVRQIIRRFRVTRGNAVLIALSLVVLGTAVCIGIIVPLFVNQFQQLIQVLPEGFRQFINWLNQWIENPPNWLPMPDVRLLPNFSDLIQQAASLSQQIFGNFFTFFSNSLSVLLQLLLVIILTLMLLADPIAYRQLILRLFPSFYRRRADSIFTSCESALINWLGAVSISSGFVALVSGLGLSVLQVKFVFAHALLAGVFNFLPNIGPTISAVFPILVALLDSPGKAIAVVALYLVIQNLESYWFSPMVMQKQVSLLPAATLIAQIFFATFLGPLGLVLALPLTVVVKTWVEEAAIKDFLDQWHSNTAQSLAIDESSDVQEYTRSFASNLTSKEHASVPISPDSPSSAHSPISDEILDESVPSSDSPESD
ncbi:MAG: AI-2E family transporter [Elainellaceae cyanobacterium]